MICFSVSHSPRTIIFLSTGPKVTSFFFTDILCMINERKIHFFKKCLTIFFSKTFLYHRIIIVSLQAHSTRSLQAHDTRSLQAHSTLSLQAHSIRFLQAHSTRSLQTHSTLLAYSNLISEYRRFILEREGEKERDREKERWKEKERIY